jgi:hypothetical protein
MNINLLRTAGLVACFASGTASAALVQSAGADEPAALTFTGSVATVKACDISSSSMTFNFDGSGLREATAAADGVIVNCAAGDSGADGSYSVAFSLSSDFTEGAFKDTTPVTFDDGSDSTITLSATDGTTDQVIDTAFLVANGQTGSYQFTATMDDDGVNGTMTQGQGATLYIAFDADGDFSNLGDLNPTPPPQDPERSGLLDTNADGKVDGQDVVDLVGTIGSLEEDQLITALDYNQSGDADAEDVSSIIGDATTAPLAMLIGDDEELGEDTAAGLLDVVTNPPINPESPQDGIDVSEEPYDTLASGPTDLDSNDDEKLDQDDIPSE